jgi:CheY-like chemotaxis protein
MKTKILQIDDDFINNMANERMLKKMGIQFEVTNFLDPTEALTFLANTDQTFDLILLDINMPRINGWEFLDRYATFEKKFPIVMLTSSLDPNDKKRANAAELLSGFFVKPLSKDMMEEILQICMVPIYRT